MSSAKNIAVLQESVSNIDVYDQTASKLKQLSVSDVKYFSFNE
jgi:hypothetical protein